MDKQQITEKLRACPLCGKDHSDKETKEKLIELCRVNGINGELVNPGGRQLRFKTTGNKWCQIIDHCFHCDYITVENFIAEERIG